MPPTPAEYAYTHVNPTWDHSIVVPSVLDAARAVPEGGAILDLGCGNGAMMAEIRRNGKWRLQGVESSTSAVAMAQSQGLDVLHADASADLTSVLPKGGFDLIVSVEVIEHVFDPRGFLRQARALLQPGGTLLLTTPYHGYLKNLVIALLGKCDTHYNPLWEGGHIKFWSKATLSAALLEAGFKDVSFRGTGRFPGLWRSMVLTAKLP